MGVIATNHSHLLEPVNTPEDLMKMVEYSKYATTLDVGGVIKSVVNPGKRGQGGRVITVDTAEYNPISRQTEQIVISSMSRLLS